jgi:hypothetical protein
VEALPENSIDAFLDEGNAQTEAFSKLADQQANLLHRVFVQSEAGAELLEKWKNDLLMIPSVFPESTQFGAGLTEGGKMFVRNIITLTEAVEKEL